MYLATNVLISLVFNRYFATTSAQDCPIAASTCDIRSCRRLTCFGHTHRKCFSSSTTNISQLLYSLSLRTRPLHRPVSMCRGNPPCAFWQWRIDSSSVWDWIHIFQLRTLLLITYMYVAWA